MDHIFHKVFPCVIGWWPELIHVLLYQKCPASFFRHNPEKTVGEGYRGQHSSVVDWCSGPSRREERSDQDQRGDWLMTFNFAQFTQVHLSWLLQLFVYAHFISNLTLNIGNRFSKKTTVGFSSACPPHYPRYSDLVRECTTTYGEPLWPAHRLP